MDPFNNIGMCLPMCIHNYGFTNWLLYNLIGTRNNHIYFETMWRCTASAHGVRPVPGGYLTSPYREVNKFLR